MEVPAEPQSGGEQRGRWVIPHSSEPSFDKLQLEINMK